MIKQPSQIHEYSLIFSGDSALSLPPEDDETTPDAKRGSRDRALETARETGQWDPLLINGETPTIFYVRPIIGAALDWFGGEMGRRNLNPAESAALALRVALRRITGFGKHEVKLVREEGVLLADQKTINALYSIDAIGRDVVQEIGGVCMLRAFGGLRPKS